MANKSIVNIILPLILVSLLIIVAIAARSQQNSQIPVVVEPNDETENWNTYDSETHFFSIKYPNDILVRQQPGDGTVSFTKIGPTQVENTEFFDGISLIFNSAPIQNTNFRDYVENKYNETKSQPIIDRIDDLTPIMIDNYQGYKFSIQAIGEYTYIYLPQGDSRILEITDATVDPTGQGFRETVDKMLSTLVIK